VKKRDFEAGEGSDTADIWADIFEELSTDQERNRNRRPSSSSSFAGIGNIFSGNFQPSFPKSFFSLPSTVSKRDSNSTLEN